MLSVESWEREEEKGERIENYWFKFGFDGFINIQFR